MSHLQTFPTQSSVLDEAALGDLLIQDQHRPAPLTCRFYSRGDADLYKVESAGERHYLKVYRPPRSSARAEAEALLVAGLADRGLPVARAVPRRDGSFAHVLQAPEGQRVALLFETARGVPPRLRDNPEGCRRLGELVARVHAAADGLPALTGLPSRGADELLDLQIERLRRFLDRTQQQELEQVAAQVRAHLARLPVTAPDHGICHADLVRSNVHEDGDGRLTLFDFGGACTTWRASELAVLHWAGRRGLEDEADRRTIWEAVLDGYQRVRPLPAGLPGELPALLICRQLEFLGGNCASLPLRLGTEPFEGRFLPDGVTRILALACEM